MNTEDLDKLINSAIDKILGKKLREDFDPNNPTISLLYKTEYCKGYRDGCAEAVKWLIGKNIFKDIEIE